MASRRRSGTGAAAKARRSSAEHLPDVGGRSRAHRPRSVRLNGKADHSSRRMTDADAQRSNGPAGEHTISASSGASHRSRAHFGGTAAATGARRLEPVQRAAAASGRGNATAAKANGLSATAPVDASYDGRKGPATRLSPLQSAPEVHYWSRPGDAVQDSNEVVWATRYSRMPSYVLDAYLDDRVDGSAAAPPTTPIIDDFATHPSAADEELLGVLNDAGGGAGYSDANGAPLLAPISYDVDSVPVTQQRWMPTQPDDMLRPQSPDGRIEPELVATTRAGEIWDRRSPNPGQVGAEAAHAGARPHWSRKRTIATQTTPRGSYKRPIGHTSSGSAAHRGKQLAGRKQRARSRTRGGSPSPGDGPRASPSGSRSPDAGARALGRARKSPPRRRGERRLEVAHAVYTFAPIPKQRSTKGRKQKRKMKAKARKERAATKLQALQRGRAQRAQLRRLREAEEALATQPRVLYRGGHRIEGRHVVVTLMPAVLPPAPGDVDAEGHPALFTPALALFAYDPVTQGEGVLRMRTSRVTSSAAGTGITTSEGVVRWFIDTRLVVEDSVPGHGLPAGALRLRILGSDAAADRARSLAAQAVARRAAEGAARSGGAACIDDLGQPTLYSGSHRLGKIYAIVTIQEPPTRPGTPGGPDSALAPLIISAYDPATSRRGTLVVTYGDINDTAAATTLTAADDLVTHFLTNRLVAKVNPDDARGLKLSLRSLRGTAEHVKRAKEQEVHSAQIRLAAGKGPKYAPLVGGRSAKKPRLLYTAAHVLDYLYCSVNVHAAVPARESEDDDSDEMTETKLRRSEISEIILTVWDVKTEKSAALRLPADRVAHGVSGNDNARLTKGILTKFVDGHVHASYSGRSGGHGKLIVTTSLLGVETDMYAVRLQSMARGKAARKRVMELRAQKEKEDRRKRAATERKVALESASDEQGRLVSSSEPSAKPSASAATPLRSELYRASHAFGELYAIVTVSATKEAEEVNSMGRTSPLETVEELQLPLDLHAFVPLTGGVAHLRISWGDIVGAVPAHTQIADGSELIATFVNSRVSVSPLAAGPEVIVHLHSKVDSDVAEESGSDATSAVETTHSLCCGGVATRGLFLAVQASYIASAEHQGAAVLVKAWELRNSARGTLSIPAHLLKAKNPEEWMLKVRQVVQARLSDEGSSILLTTTLAGAKEAAAATKLQAMERGRRNRAEQTKERKARRDAAVLRPEVYRGSHKLGSTYYLVTITKPETIDGDYSVAVYNTLSGASGSMFASYSDIEQRVRNSEVTGPLSPFYTFSQFHISAKLRSAGNPRDDAVAVTLKPSVVLDAPAASSGLYYAGLVRYGSQVYAVRVTTAAQQLSDAHKEASVTLWDVVTKAVGCARFSLAAAARAVGNFDTSVLSTEDVRTVLEEFCSASTREDDAALVVSCTLNASPLPKAKPASRPRGTSMRKTPTVGPSRRATLYAAGRRCRDGSYINLRIQRADTAAVDYEIRATAVGAAGETVLTIPRMEISRWCGADPATASKTDLPVTMVARFAEEAVVVEAGGSSPIVFVRQPAASPSSRPRRSTLWAAGRRTDDGSYVTIRMFPAEEGDGHDGTGTGEVKVYLIVATSVGGRGQTTLAVSREDIAAVMEQSSVDASSGLPTAVLTQFVNDHVTVSSGGPEPHLSWCKIGSEDADRDLGPVEAVAGPRRTARRRSTLWARGRRCTDGSFCNLRITPTTPQGHSYAVVATSVGTAREDRVTVARSEIESVAGAGTVDAGRELPPSVLTQFADDRVVVDVHNGAPKIKVTRTQMSKPRTAPKRRVTMVATGMRCSDGSYAHLRVMSTDDKGKTYSVLVTPVGAVGQSVVNVSREEIVRHTGTTARDGDQLPRGVLQQFAEECVSLASAASTPRITFAGSRDDIAMTATSALRAKPTTSHRSHGRSNKTQNRTIYAAGRRAETGEYVNIRVESSAPTAQYRVVVTRVGAVAETCAVIEQKTILEAGVAADGSPAETAAIRDFVDSHVKIRVLGGKVQVAVNSLRRSKLPSVSQPPGERRGKSATATRRRPPMVAAAGPKQGAARPLNRARRRTVTAAGRKTATGEYVNIRVVEPSPSEHEDFVVVATMVGAVAEAQLSLDRATVVRGVDTQVLALQDAAQRFVDRFVEVTVVDGVPVLSIRAAKVNEQRVNEARLALTTLPAAEVPQLLSNNGRDELGKRVGSVVAAMLGDTVFDEAVLPSWLSEDTIVGRLLGVDTRDITGTRRESAIRLLSRVHESAISRGGAAESVIAWCAAVLDVDCGYEAGAGPSTSEGGVTCVFGTKAGEEFVNVSVVARGETQLVSASTVRPAVLHAELQVSVGDVRPADLQQMLQRRLRATRRGGRLVLSLADA